MSRSSATTFRGVRLTHPDKILYPDQGVSKVDLARYYESVADAIMPHVARRPLTVVRCPEGRARSCFYQKHLRDGDPDEISGVRIAEKGGGRPTYLEVRDLEGLVGLVQIGVLEIHPWGSRSDRPDRPDRIVFDLDPGPGTSWDDVVAAARRLRDILEEVDLRGFVKTSGGKGLHVVLPITRRSEWEEVREFAAAVARRMAREEPETYVAVASKEKREGKVFVDYLRNSRGATSIAAFSTRARNGAPVSVPVRWEEIGTLGRGDRYTVSNLPSRLSRLRSDPWGELDSTKQGVTRSVKEHLGI